MASKSSIPLEVVHVEVVQRASSSLSPKVLGDLLLKRLNQCSFIHAGALDTSTDAELWTHVERARICDLPDGKSTVSSLLCELNFAVYTLATAPAHSEADVGEGGSAQTTWTSWDLPHRELEGLWESLEFGSEARIKDGLLAYAASSLLFSRAAVSPLLVTWNHLVLLHGPPGTGKTSIARALAHKLAVRHAATFRSASLVEINAHALFSRWYSESGKLVARLFARIADLAADGKWNRTYRFEDTLVVVMIDEVESLTAARTAAQHASEPTDSLRVVNAVLTAIDALRAKPNVLIVATSNLCTAIDAAFVDRADVKLLVGLPSPRARYAMLATSFAELQRVGIVSPPVELSPFADHEAGGGGGACRDWADGDVDSDAGGRDDAAGCARRVSALVMLAARNSLGLSGRTLRKLPLQAHARLARCESAAAHPVAFARALVDAVAAEIAVRGELGLQQPTGPE